MPVIPSLKLIFIHIPKTGGSSINKFLKLDTIRENKSIVGYSEQKLPGLATCLYGDRFITPSRDLRQYLNQGDYLRIGKYLYQVNANYPINTNRIYLASLDNADNIMKGNLAKQNTNFIGENKNYQIFKKLVTDDKANKIIPSKYHWGWITTTQKNNNPLIQVFNNNLLKKNKKPALELDHVSIRYIQARLPNYIFSQMTAFAFVRNPYSRLVSEYFWKKKDQTNGQDVKLGINCLTSTFKEFVYQLSDKWETVMTQPQAEVSHYLPQYLFICDDNDNIIVHYEKYENGLDNGLSKIVRQYNLDLPSNIKLPKNNTTTQFRSHYSHYYDVELQELVYRLYHKDFTHFNYSKDLEIN
jgi:hypothetical protein